MIFRDFYSWFTVLLFSANQRVSVCCLFALSIFSTPNGSFPWFYLTRPSTLPSIFFSSLFDFISREKSTPIHPTKRTEKKNIRKIILLFHSYFLLSFSFFRFFILVVPLLLFNNPSIFFCYFELKEKIELNIVYDKVYC